MQKAGTVPVYNSYASLSEKLNVDSVAEVEEQEEDNNWFFI